MELRTVEWKDDSVIMIDQTKLPNELVFAKYTDYNDCLLYTSPSPRD